MRTPRIPILMYHKVGAEVRERRDSFLNVSARSFARQMRLMKRLGYRGVTLAEAADGLAGIAPLPPRPVCITFDDAYTCVASHAAPELGEHNWPATLFIPTAFVGESNEWDRAAGLPILPIMDWDALLSLQRAGWEMSGHTRSHVRLAELDDGPALREMQEGKQDLEARLGCSVRTFCYPFGSVGEKTPELAREAGFAAACTTRSGLASARVDPMLLPRVKIAYRDDVWGLLYRLLIRPRLP